MLLLDAEFDHVVPLGLGGGNDPNNWAALCPYCHKRKTRADLRRIAKAKRQRRYHETGRSRAPRVDAPPGLKRKAFPRDLVRHLNGMTSTRCDCQRCRRRS